LGPLLFIIYTHDLPNSLKNTRSILFADDKTILAHDLNLNNLYSKTNYDSDSLYDWLKANKLSLNINKTNYMLLTTNTNTQPNQTINQIKIGNEKVLHKSSVKFLGLEIDEKLNWHEQIE
jgi:hypothetical protein